MDENNVTVDDMRAAFGLDVETDESDVNVEDDQDINVEDETIPEDDQQIEEDSNEPESEFESEVQQQTQESQQQESASNQAFARMRTENASLQKSLKAVARVLGLDPNLPVDQLSAAIQQQSYAAIGRQTNVDPNLVKELDDLRQIKDAYNQRTIEDKAKSAFMNIQEKYHATAQDLNSFVNELVSEGYDMSAPGANLEHEFISRNFDKIIQMKVDEAVQAEQKRSSNGKAASKPNNKQGAVENTDDQKEINTVEGLNEFLNSINN